MLPRKIKPMPLDTLHYAQDCIHLVDKTTGIMYCMPDILKVWLKTHWAAVTCAERVGQVETLECCERESVHSYDLPSNAKNIVHSIKLRTNEKGPLKIQHKTLIRTSTWAYIASPSDD